MLHLLPPHFTWSLFSVLYIYKHTHTGSQSNPIWKGSWRIYPLAQSRADVRVRSRCWRPCPSWVLKIFENEDSTAFLGDLFQDLSNLMVKNHFHVSRTSSKHCPLAFLCAPHLHLYIYIIVYVFIYITIYIYISQGYFLKCFSFISTFPLPPFLCLPPCHF